jgi:hypothetical protein
MYFLDIITSLSPEKPKRHPGWSGVEGLSCFCWMILGSELADTKSQNLQIQNLIPDTSGFKS